MAGTKARFFAKPEEFRAWLDENHGAATEQWVGFWKKASGRPSITWPQAVDEALCFGWIDGVRKSLGDSSYAIRFTPRRRGSHWSSVNVRRAQALLKEGRIRPAGLAAFEARKADKTGAYSYEQKATAELTATERKRFRANAAAWKDFEARAPYYRKAVLRWVTSAKRPETRERRLRVLTDCCARGKPIPLMARGK